MERTVRGLFHLFCPSWPTSSAAIWPNQIYSSLNKYQTKINISERTKHKKLFLVFYFFWYVLLFISFSLIIWPHCQLCGYAASSLVFTAWHFVCSSDTSLSCGTAQCPGCSPMQQSFLFWQTKCLILHGQHLWLILRNPVKLVTVVVFIFISPHWSQAAESGFKYFEPMMFIWLPMDLDINVKDYLLSWSVEFNDRASCTERARGWSRHLTLPSLSVSCFICVICVLALVQSRQVQQ